MIGDPIKKFSNKNQNKKLAWINMIFRIRYYSYRNKQSLSNRVYAWNEIFPINLFTQPKVLSEHLEILQGKCAWHESSFICCLCMCCCCCENKGVRANERHSSKMWASLRDLCIFRRIIVRLFLAKEPPHDSNERHHEIILTIKATTMTWAHEMFSHSCAHSDWRSRHFNAHSSIE